MDTPTLAQQGYRMPPEWHPHAATWVAWPHNQETWPVNLREAQGEFLALVSAIAQDEPVIVIAPQRFHETLQSALRIVPGMIADNVSIQIIDTNDAWARDYAPTFVINQSKKQLAAIDWHYNAWGGKYPPYGDDQKVAEQIARQIPSRVCPDSGCHYIRESLCAEGGALEVNENGVLLCAISSVANPNRNPVLTLEQIEQIWASNLGATQIVWLSGDTSVGPAILGDDTDAHIDQLARFTPKGPIVHAWTDDRDDPQHKALKRNRDDLEAGLRRIGFSDQLVPLPLPDPVEFGGSRLPASYCNFYITNRSVIVPQFNRLQDQVALKRLEPLFPDRRIVGLPSTNLCVGLGSFHCLTQQQPYI
jgi:agmatine deiminase